METLADRIAREGPLNELDAVGWAIRLAKRIEGMHALGVTHGSLSPGCLLIGATDRAARAQLVDVRRSSPSLSCQSPERVNGGGLSQADDTWALACTLYAALTGSSPFSGADAADVKQRILASAPAPLAVFDVGDDDLQRIFDDAFARDIGHRTTSVAALRTALEEWHPDPNVGALPAVEEEEDAEAAGFSDDDDEDQRTIMRSSPGTAPRIQLPGSAGFPQVVPPPRASPRAASPAFPPPVTPPAALPGSAPPEDDDEDEDARTVMRTVPEHFARSALAGGASRSGAFAAMTPGKSGAFPAGAPLPEVGDEHDDDEATRMMSTPAQLAQDDDDDDDEQKTLMRSSTLDEAAARMAGSAGSERAARPLPAAGARPAAWVAPPPAAAFPGPAPAPSWGAGSGAAPGIGARPPAEAPGAPPVLPAAPLPVAAVPGAAPVALAGGPAPLAAPPARRTAVWLVLLTLIVAAGATYVFLRMR